jgi:hypothetical protein
MSQCTFNGSAIKCNSLIVALDQGWPERYKLLPFVFCMEFRTSRAIQKYLILIFRIIKYISRYNLKMSRDSSVGIALGYGVDDRGSRVQFPAVAGNVSLHHRFQNGCGAHPASYPMVPGALSLGVKREADHSPPSSAQVKE